MPVQALCARMVLDEPDGRYPHAKVIGLDGADSMLDLARKAILRHSSLADRVNVNPLGSKKFHAVVSKQPAPSHVRPARLGGRFARWPRELIS
jgi:hypothetical protein